jgi:hypothetical protein
MEWTSQDGTILRNCLHPRTVPALQHGDYIGTCARALHLLRRPRLEREQAACEALWGDELMRALGVAALVIVGTPLALVGGLILLCCLRSLSHDLIRFPLI